MAAIDSPAGPSMAVKFAIDGPAGPVVGGTIGGVTCQLQCIINHVHASLHILFSVTGMDRVKYQMSDYSIFSHS